uniref:Methyltransferase n=1 Tax=Kalanchoe fedtschenkoi TaxID=63787 RepID=A0A7N0T5T0_KALFE
MRGGSWPSRVTSHFARKLPPSWLLLCLVGVLALLAFLGSPSWNEFDSAASSGIPSVYTSYRRLKEQAAIDYYDLRAVSLGLNRQRELSLCGKESEHYVPCYNMTETSSAGFRDGEQYDRHCELAQGGERCLIRPPKDYKIPLKWPAGRDVIWSGNVKIKKEQFLSSGSMTKRLMLLEENQISFQSDDGLSFDGVRDYSRQLAEMIGLGSDVEFPQACIRNVLDIGCGFGSFGAHLVSLNVMAVCVAEYEAAGSQVQMALERGLPAMIGSFVSKQLPYPVLSFDMVHCAQCGINWDGKDGMFLMEVDRVLKPGGYFVLTSSASKPFTSASSAKKSSVLTVMEGFARKICWSLLSQQDETLVWQKTADASCYSSRSQDSVPLCGNAPNDLSYYQPLASCLSGSSSKRWIPIQNRTSDSQWLDVHGVRPEDFWEDSQAWEESLRNYWSLLTPLIFSDHPKRPGDEDPLPPYNMIRNVMDMSAKYGGLNAALLKARKSVWVMNVVPVGAPNTLPIILDQSFAGTLHDWCEPFPTYPRTYDMLHADGLLTHLTYKNCDLMDLFLEMDRILRPEGWVVLHDNAALVEVARVYTAQVRWEGRVMDPQDGSDQRLLVCQKPFLRK